MSFTVGENVGPYRLVEQLGSGGMATVFKAYHAALDRYVAIKVLHPAFKEDTTFLARFQREARVVARLEHPNIVPVYDFAEHKGDPYLVMKFVEGETLKARLSRERLSLQETLRVLEAVGAGLDYAHRQGILHRDIKSSNIMLAADGNIYLADFGLARIAVAGESTLSVDSMIGTPHYMSPEQAKGVKDLDAGADIYSLGVVLYELVVGRLPFSADTPFAIIHDHIYTPLPPPRTVNPNVPEAVERVLLESLAKERNDRYPDVAAQVAAFREAVSASTPGVVALPGAIPVSPSAPTASAATRLTRPAPGATPPKARSSYQFRWWHGVLAALLLLGCGLLGLAAFNRRNPAGQSAPTLAPTQAVTVQANQPPATNPPPETQPANVPAWRETAEQAATLFATGKPEEALARLAEMVRINARDPGAHLFAGNLALANNRPLEAVGKFYLPGLALNPEGRESVFAQLREHTALALYVAAADPGAEQFLLDLGTSGALTDSSAGLALQRWRLFNGDVEAARSEIENLVQSERLAEGPQLTYGDYFLKVGKPGEAAIHYELASRNPPGAREPIAWLALEAKCRQRQLRERRAELTATCEPLPTLVQTAREP